MFKSRTTLIGVLGLNDSKLGPNTKKKLRLLAGLRRGCGEDNRETFSRSLTIKLNLAYYSHNVRLSSSAILFTSIKLETYKYKINCNKLYYCNALHILQSTMELRYLKFQIICQINYHNFFTLKKHSSCRFT